MAQRILGIDIGTFSVKLALLERAFSEFKVLNLLEQPLNLQTRLPHEELVVLALEQAFKTRDFTADVVATSFPGHLLSCRVLEMPFTNAKKISEVIEFELEGYVPFEMEDLHFDFHVLQRFSESSRLLCVYMQQEKFSSYLENLAKAGLDPKYMGADLIDLASIAQVTMVPRDEYYALCDIGHSKTNVCVMKGTELHYARTIGIGGVHFTRAIQRAFNVNYEKAESLKLSRGRLFIREQDSDQVSRVITHVSTELVSCIKQTFLGFDNLAGRQNIAAIYCVGGGSRLNGLMEFLSFHLRANVLEMDALAAVDHSMDDAGEANRVMAQAIANAVRPVFSNRLPRINFRKGPFAFKQDIQLFTQELKHAGALMVAVLLLAVGYYFYADYHYAEKTAAIDAKIQKILRDEFPDIAGAKARGGLTKLMKQAETKFKDLKQQSAGLFGGGISVLGIMQEIAGKLPAKKDVKLEFAEFNFADDYVRINARTDDPLNVTKIVAALKASDMFPEIEATDPQSKPNNLWDFQMKIDFKQAEK